MIYKEILTSTDFMEMWEYLITQYDDQNNDDTLMAYKTVFDKLKTLEPVDSDLKIQVRYVESEHYTGWSVDGTDGETTYAIEYTAWNEWLGMEISQGTLDTLKPHEIAAHCLWEMTFVGYNEVDIQGKMGEINAMTDKIIREYKD